MIKIGDVYYMGDYFEPYAVDYARMVKSTYGTGFGVIGFEGTDLKSYLLWILSHLKNGNLPTSALFVKESYLSYYVPTDNIWVNLWRLGMHASPMGLEGDVVLIPYTRRCHFYKLALIHKIENIMKESNITDINMLSIVEKKIYETKVDIILDLEENEIQMIDGYICKLYADNMFASLAGAMKRRFRAKVRGMCSG